MGVNEMFAPIFLCMKGWIKRMDIDLNYLINNEIIN